jgi:hypothetical protein
MRSWLSITLLLLVGIGLAVATRVVSIDRFTTIGLVLITLASLVPVVRAFLTRALDHLRNTKPLYTSAALGLLALAVYAHGALTHRAYLGPKTHDEHSYTLGALLLAEGKLWSHDPIAAAAPDSVESFHILTRPVYGSIYFPGTALLHVPAVWLDLPGWLTPVLLASACVPLAFLLLRNLLPTDLAALAALLLMSGPSLRDQSIAVMSQVPSLLLGTATLLAALHWTRKPSILRATLIGLLSGWLCITRPQDAAFFLPAALLPTFRTPRKLWFRGALTALAVMAPFAILVAVQNSGMTGSPFRTAYWQYTQLNQPGTGFLSHPPNTAATPATQPLSLLPQKHDYNTLFGAEHRDLRGKGLRPGILQPRLAGTLENTLPLTGLIVLIPLGIVALARSAPGPSLLLCLAGYAVIYGSFTFFLGHYSVPITLAVVATVAAAVSRLSELGSYPRAALAAVCFLAAASRIPALNPAARDWQIDTNVLALADSAERSIADRPALLLIRYTPGANFHQEPVYNLHTAALKDNPVLRAHDLGPELNDKLFRALLDLGQDRHVHLLDRRRATLTPLGRVSELLGK